MNEDELLDLFKSKADKKRFDTLLSLLANNKTSYLNAIYSIFEKDKGNNFRKFKERANKILRGYCEIQIAGSKKAPAKREVHLVLTPANTNTQDA